MRKLWTTKYLAFYLAISWVLCCFSCIEPALATVNGGGYVRDEYHRKRCCVPEVQRAGMAIMSVAYIGHALAPHVVSRDLAYHRRGKRRSGIDVLSAYIGDQIFFKKL